MEIRNKEPKLLSASSEIKYTFLILSRLCAGL